MPGDNSVRIVWDNVSETEPDPYWEAFLEGREGYLRDLSVPILDCVARDDRSASADLDCGRAWVVLDTYVADGEELDGDYTVTIELEPGRTVFSRGDPADALHVIQSGCVEIRDPAAPDSPPGQVGPGAAFGRRAFVAGTPHSSTAVAVASAKASSCSGVVSGWSPSSP